MDIFTTLVLCDSIGVMNIFILFFLILFPILSHSTIPTEDCLGCHEKFTTFKHGNNKCIQCHSDITSLPHDEKLKKPSCNNCHKQTSDIYEGSIHKKNLSCKDCHDVHFIERQKKYCIDCHVGVSHDSLPSKEKHLQGMECLACHGKTTKGNMLINIQIDQKTSISRDILDPDKNRFLSRIEWDNLQTILLNKYKGKHQLKKQYVVLSNAHSIMKKPVSCNVCHNEKGIFQHAKITISGVSPSVFSADPKIFIPELPSIKDYKHTIHGKKGIECFDCHVSQERISDSTCITCHDELYGVYKNTVHSKKGAALCTDCHNPHYTKAYKELGVPDRLGICVRCHKDYIEMHKWLPNTVLHFNYLECSTCHSPDSTKSMVLSLALRENGVRLPIKYSDLEKAFGKGINVKDFIDKDADGTIRSEELAHFFLELTKIFGKDIAIISSIVVTKVHHNYSEKNTKSKVCATCHSEEAPFYESFFISIPEKEESIYIPVKGSVISAFPSSIFIDMCLLGEEKIKAADFTRVFKAGRKDRPQIIDELGFKLIDFIGIILALLIFSGIIIHIILRVVVKR